MRETFDFDAATRVAANAERADRDAAALKYLTDRGMHEVAQVLGLLPSPRPKARRRKAGASE